MPIVEVRLDKFLGICRNLSLTQYKHEAGICSGQALCSALYLCNTENPHKFTYYAAEVIRR